MVIIFVSPLSHFGVATLSTLLKNQFRQNVCWCVVAVRLSHSATSFFLLVEFNFMGELTEKQKKNQLLKIKVIVQFSEKQFA
jgi:hypothetical protein